MRSLFVLLSGFCSVATADGLRIEFTAQRPQSVSQSFASVYDGPLEGALTISNPRPLSNGHASFEISDFDFFVLGDRTGSGLIKNTPLSFFQVPNVITTNLLLTDSLEENPVQPLSGDLFAPQTPLGEVFNYQISVEEQLLYEPPEIDVTGGDDEGAGIAGPIVTGPGGPTDSFEPLPQDPEYGPVIVISLLGPAELLDEYGSLAAPPPLELLDSATLYFLQPTSLILGSLGGGAPGRALTFPFEITELTIVPEPHAAAIVLSFCSASLIIVARNRLAPT